MFTWLWNIRHRKLIAETKAIIRLHHFLRYDCGLKEVDKLFLLELKYLLMALKRLDIDKIVI